MPPKFFTPTQNKPPASQKPRQPQFLSAEPTPSQAPQKPQLVSADGPAVKLPKSLQKPQQIPQVQHVTSSESRPTPKFITPITSTALLSSQKRPQFQRQQPPPPSTPTPAPRRFASTVPDHHSSDTVEESSLSVGRKRPWLPEPGDSPPGSSPLRPQTPPPIHISSNLDSSPLELTSPSLNRLRAPFLNLPLPGISSGPSSGASTPLINRPLFRVLEDDDSAMNLPKDWSPKKKKKGKGGKYIPDGMAENVAGWVLETRQQQGRKEGGKVTVEEWKEGDGYLNVAGGGERLMLMKGRKKEEIGVGTVVRYDAPWWEIDGWRVCVFWRTE